MTRDAAASRPVLCIATAAALMALGSAVAPFVDGAGKLLVATYPILQIVWMRYAGHALAAGLATARAGNIGDLKPAPAQMARGAVQFGSSLFFLAALARLSLNTALIIVFLAPLMVTVVRYALGQVGTDRTSVAIAGAGALGVAVCYAPGLKTLDPLGILFALLAAVLFAAYFLLTGSAGQRIGSVAASFHAALPGALLGLPFLLFAHVVPRAGDWPILVMLGLASALSHWLICTAMRTPVSSAITPVAYVEVPAGALYAIFMFGHRPTLPEMVGGAVVTMAGLACAWRLKVITGDSSPSLTDAMPP